MDDYDFWRLSDFLNVFHAAALMVGASPSYLDNDDPSYLRLPFPEYDGDVAEKINRNMRASVIALQHAIKKGRLKADLIQNEYTHFNDTVVTDNWWETLIEVDDIRDWLLTKGLRPKFFFPETVSAPDYLDPNNSCYAPKLAGAVRAWQAVTSDKKYANNGKTVKQNLESWLTAHAAEFSLVKDDGEINTEAIKNQIAKVANWNDGGGAPKTPGE